MNQNKAQAVALMRYAVIAPLISGLSDAYPSNEAFFRDASLKGVLLADGSTRHFAPQTIKYWYRNYLNQGFDGLLPSSRSDSGQPRKLDDDLQAQIRYLKENYPRMSAAAIFRQLRENGSVTAGQLSESTVNRFIRQLALEMKTTTNHDMRRYERPHINEVWCGDSSVGPYLKTPDGKKHRVFIIALIDDASRLIVGIDVFFNDNFTSLSGLRDHLRAYVLRYNQTPHSSLKGLSPQDRFFSEPQHIRRLSDEEIEKHFLLEIERRVSIDSVITIDQVEYEVDCRFARQRICLRYSPDMEKIFIAEADGTLTPIRLLNKHENAFVKREKIHLCRGDAS